MTAGRVGDWAMVPFRKSSFSSTNGGDCVEVGSRHGLVAVRDSKCPGAGLVEIPEVAWARFSGRVAGLTDPERDQLGG